MTDNVSKRAEQLEKLWSTCNDLAPLYQRKWEGLFLQTGRIDQGKAKEAINAVYSVLNLPLPEIRFYASPDAAQQDTWYQQSPSTLLPDVISWNDHMFPPEEVYRRVYLDNLIFLFQVINQAPSAQSLFWELCFFGHCLGLWITKQDC